MDAWQTRPLGNIEVVYAYLDALALRVRSGGKVVRVPVLAAVGVLADGQKVLVELDLCGGGSYEAWKGCLDGLVAGGLQAPLLCIIDGHAGLRRAVGEVWARAAVQRRCVHTLRNLERKAPKHVLDELRADFHRIVYAASAEAARAAWTAFELAWETRCPGVVKSLQEEGVELLTFFSFPTAREGAGRAAHRGQCAHSPLRPRRHRPDHVAQARRLYAPRFGDPPADARGVSGAARGGISRSGRTPQRGCDATCGAAFSRRAALDCAQEPDRLRSTMKEKVGVIFGAGAAPHPLGTHLARRRRPRTPDPSLV